MTHTTLLFEKSIWKYGQSSTPTTLERYAMKNAMLKPKHIFGSTLLELEGKCSKACRTMSSPMW